MSGLRYQRLFMIGQCKFRVPPLKVEINNGNWEVSKITKWQRHWFVNVTDHEPVTDYETTSEHWDQLFLPRQRMADPFYL